MTTIIVDHTAEPGGAQIGMTNMVRAMPSAFEVLLLEDGPVADTLRAQGKEPHVVPLNHRLGQHLIGGRPWAKAPQILRASRELHRVLAEMARTCSASTIMLNTLRSVMLVAVAGVPAGLRCVVMLRDGTRPPYLSRPESLATRWSIDRVADEIVANSGWTARQLGTRTDLRVVPPFVAESFFTEPVRPLFERPSASVLLLGRIAPWKGQVLGLDAARRVRRGGPWSLTVAGGPWFGEEAYHDQVRREAATTRNVAVTVLGHVADVRELIDRHDVVLHTSVVPEPFGQVLVQSMARGRVVIAARAGGPTEILRDGETGHLYHPGDPAALAETLENVLVDRARQHGVGNAARVASEEFHPHLTARKIAHLLDLVP